MRKNKTAELPAMHPPGTKERPYKRTCRQVGKNNPSIIIGLPLQVTQLANIKPGDEFKLYITDIDPSKKHFKIILER